MRSEFSNHLAIDVNNQKADEGTRTANLDYNADVEVLSVDSKGSPTGLRSTVRSSSARLDGKSVGAIPPGTVVESLKVTGDERAKGLPFVLEPEINHLAETIFAASKPDDDTEQEVFGPHQPVSVGGRWEINLDRVRREMSSTGFSVRDAKLTGSGTFLDTPDLKGVKCLHTRATAYLSGFKVDLPDGFAMNTAAGGLTYDSYIAIDGGRRLKDSLAFDFDLSIRNARGILVSQKLLMSYSREFQ